MVESVANRDEPRSRRSLGASLRELVARAWLHAFQLRFAVANIQFGLGTLVATFLAASLATVWAIPSLSQWVEGLDPSSQLIDQARDVLSALGGALVAATAFAFSLVMFAMQVNVERMPHGLFRKFSSDPGLLLAFLASFVAALAVALSPLILSADTLALVAVSVFWAIVISIGLFLFAYRRALKLINPAEQLKILVSATQRDLRTWRQMGERTRALLESNLGKPEGLSRLAPQPDIALTAFYRMHPSWIALAGQSIDYAMTFSRRYSEVGDHEVGAIALNAVLSVHATYVKAKGATFYAQHLFEDNPLITDGFLNHTLEHLRQNVRVGLTRGDERAVAQNLRALSKLTKVYLAADYGGEHQPKTHAFITSGYLADAALSVAPNNFPDLLIEGTRLIGEAAQDFIRAKQFTDASIFPPKLAGLAVAGLHRPAHGPVTLTAVEELSKITFNLIRSTQGDVRYPITQTKNSVSEMVLRCLETPDSGLESGHAFYLGPYYTGTSERALLAWLHDLVVELMNAEASSETAATVLTNLEIFSDGLYRSEREILLTAVRLKSRFTNDTIYWIASLSKLLWAASASPACHDGTREKLQRNGLWLASSLSWIPGEVEAIHTVEAYRLSDTLFDLAIEAHHRAEHGIALHINDLQLSWLAKVSQFDDQWSSAAEALCGLAAMSVVRGDLPRVMIALDKLLIESTGKLDQETLDHAAREVRQRAESLWNERGRFSKLSHALGSLDHAKLEPAMKALADAVSPGTKDEEVDPGAF